MKLSQMCDNLYICLHRTFDTCAGYVNNPTLVQPHISYELEGDGCPGVQNRDVMVGDHDALGAAYQRLFRPHSDNRAG